MSTCDSWYLISTVHRTGAAFTPWELVSRDDGRNTHYYVAKQQLVVNMFGIGHASQNASHLQYLCHSILVVSLRSLPLSIHYFAIPFPNVEQGNRCPAVP